MVALPSGKNPFAPVGRALGEDYRCMAITFSRNDFEGNCLDVISK
jgi:hypothetical protein